MEKLFKERLNNISKILLHHVQEVRNAVKKEDELRATREAREALNMASWVITYGAALTTIKQKDKKEQECTRTCD